MDIFASEEFYQSKFLTLVITNRDFAIFGSVNRFRLSHETSSDSFLMVGIYGRGHPHSISNGSLVNGDIHPDNESETWTNSFNQYRAKCETLNVNHVGSDIYTVSYEIKIPGDYLIFVKWGDAHVPGSPFEIRAS
ncbi:unnamed protein product [Gordionus sp. m RMFG-2023]